MLAWHFLQSDRKLQFDPFTPVVCGETLKVEPPLRMCDHGLHASEKLGEALRFAPGPIICRVRLGGEMLHDKYKSCASERTVLWMRDASRLLHEFVFWCYEEAIPDYYSRVPKESMELLYVALRQKRSWLDGQITDIELKAAAEAFQAAELVVPTDAEDICNTMPTRAALYTMQNIANDAANFAGNAPMGRMTWTNAYIQCHKQVMEKFRSELEARILRLGETPEAIP